jgi:hypothetical protein
MQGKSSRLHIVLFLFASTLFATAGIAQGLPEGGPPDGGPPPDSPMQRPSPKEAAAAELKGLTKKLKLSEQQKTSITPLLQDEHEQMDALFQKSASMEKTMAGIKAIRENSNKKIRDLLTDDQKKQFDKLGMPFADGPDGPPPGVGPPPE